MDGIEGLKLISITPNILSTTQIISIKLIIIFLSVTSIVSLFIAIKNNIESKARLIPPIILILITTVLIIMTLYGLNKHNKDIENGNIDSVYTFEVTNEDYNIDLDIYKVIEITDNIVKITKEKTKD